MAMDKSKSTKGMIQATDGTLAACSVAWASDGNNAIKATKPGIFQASPILFVMDTSAKLKAAAILPF
jgi:hypothetical protein